MSARKEVIFIFRHHKGFNIILALTLTVISGCTYIPTKDISFITSSKNKIYFSMSNGKMRDLDKDTLRWSDIAIPDMDKPAIINAFNDNGNIVIQAVDYGWKNPSVYLLNWQTGIIKAAFSQKYGSLSMGGDSEFLYFIDTEYKSVDSVDGNWLISGSRYDREFKTRTAHHFDEYQNLLVTDIWEDTGYYWFACINSQPVREINAPAGEIVLIAKSKSTGALEKFELDTGRADWDKLLMDGTKLLSGKDGGNAKSGPWDMLWVRGDEDFIWLFAKGSKDAVTLLIKFSKAGRAIEYKKELIATLVPFRGQNAKGELWAVGSDFKTCQLGNRCVYKIDKDGLKTTTVSMPSGIVVYPFDWNYHNSNIIRPFNPFYEDDNSLWIFAAKARKVFTPSGCCVPYLVRLSKKDMSYEMILIEPTASEAFITVLHNFLGWLMVPFLRS